MERAVRPHTRRPTKTGVIGVLSGLGYDGAGRQSAPHSRGKVRRVGALLTRRTVRTRLTLLYGWFFLASGAFLVVLSVSLFRHTTSATAVAAVPASVAAIHHAPLPSGGLSAQHALDIHLLAYGGLALAITAILSLGLGWLLAGRVLQPLRAMTTAARDMSATSLHRRFRLEGPNDELKELGDTFDGLLDRLERTFERQRQFVANASHELRTPLATMRASVDVAVAKPGQAPPQVLSLADGLRQDLDQMDSLLDGLLTLARAQRGARDDDVALSLDGLVAAALERRQPDIASRHLRVEQQRCRDAVVVGSATLLARMVENVVDNAVVHNQAGGWIRARSEVVGGRARLVVENGGPMLDPREVQQLGHPFRRLGPQRVGEGGGSGLGLSIVASVVEAHGGALRLDAREDGGLRVAIDLRAAGAVGAGAGA